MIVIAELRFDAIPIIFVAAKHIHQPFVRHAELPQRQRLGNFFRHTGHARHDEAGMNRPNLTVSQFDASLEYAGLVGGGFVVQLVSLREGFGKNFGVQAIMFVEPRPEISGD